MESLKNPSIPEMLSFLEKKYSIQEKDLIFRQEKFEIEIENVKKKLEEEKRGIEGRCKTIMEQYKEENQVLYNRIDELKMEKSRVEGKLRDCHVKLIELNGRVSCLKEEMRKINEEQLNSAKNGKSRNEEPLPINLDSESGDPTRSPSACQAIFCFKDNLNAVSDKPEHLPVVMISDDEMDRNELASDSNPCGLCGSLACCQKKKEVHVQDSSNSNKKRKRSMDEGENRDGSSCKIERVVPSPGKNSVFIRPCEDKVGFKCHSELPLRISDKPYQSGDGNEVRKWLSEENLCTAFVEDPELCLNAVCALYRQQISENKSSYYMSQTDEYRQLSD
ncbi:uncharacterized protein LOC129890300 isoform X2 [Solanum dulcamara]|uniref:uncharacterized protein LOC129890300 isoform X2 n=1 Tax=Solanum dulcamara TaxID=45834 RepID=UPI002485354F|nr:uncharacterized protein LOC129890300 isoform X2 [Solanum dulcamara]